MMTADQVISLFEAMKKLQVLHCPSFRADNNTRRSVLPLTRHLQRFIFCASLAELDRVAVSVDHTLVNAGFGRVRATLRAKFQSLAVASLSNKKVFLRVCQDVGINFI